MRKAISSIANFLGATIIGGLILGGAIILLPVLIIWANWQSKYKTQFLSKRQVEKIIKEHGDVFDELAKK